MTQLPATLTGKRPDQLPALSSTSRMGLPLLLHLPQSALKLSTVLHARSRPWRTTRQSPRQVLAHDTTRVNMLDDRVTVVSD